MAVEGEIAVPILPEKKMQKLDSADFCPVHNVTT